MALENVEDAKTDGIPSFPTLLSPPLRNLNVDSIGSKSNSVSTCFGTAGPAPEFQEDVQPSRTILCLVNGLVGMACLMMAQNPGPG